MKTWTNKRHDQILENMQKFISQNVMELKCEYGYNLNTFQITLALNDGSKVDYWFSTGSWLIRKGMKRGYGWKSLIKNLKGVID